MTRMIGSSYESNDLMEVDDIEVLKRDLFSCLVYGV